jgi:hypothetical protein
MPLSEPSKLKISDVCQKFGYSYQKVFLAVVSGAIPAERDESGSRWVIRREDLPAIAKVLGRTTTPRS